MFRMSRVGTIRQSVLPCRSAFRERDDTGFVEAGSDPVLRFDRAHA
jgi:hypothetical protein